jgi:transposase
MQRRRVNGRFENQFHECGARRQKACRRQHKRHDKLPTREAHRLAFLVNIGLHLLNAGYLFPQIVH